MAAFKIIVAIIGLIGCLSIIGRYLFGLTYWIFALIDEFDDNAFNDEGWWFRHDRNTLSKFVNSRKHFTEFYEIYDNYKWVPGFNIVTVCLYIICVSLKTIGLIFYKVIEYILVPIITFIGMKIFSPTFKFMKKVAIFIFDNLGFHKIANALRDWKHQVTDKIMNYKLS